MLQSLCPTLPVIMAPMFLVSHTEMLSAGMKAGILSVFPSLNFREEEQLQLVLDSLWQTKHQGAPGHFGVNLIVQKTNIYLEKHLKRCVASKVPFYITSLGNPEQVIEQANSYGALVFCDVTNLTHAEKCAKAGCHGFIAVGQGAGGHAGNNPLHILIPSLKKHFPHIPVAAAGGLAHGRQLYAMKILGADYFSIGTRFIASKEAGVNEAYKQAIVEAGMDDIVMTTRLSGTPCTIINTPEAAKMGYEQNFIEKWLSRNPSTKKWFKMALQYRGMKKLEKAVLPNNYSKLWCAGKSVEMIQDIPSVQEIVMQLKKEWEETQKSM